jgi:aldose 1-epimerase
MESLDYLKIPPMQINQVSNPNTLLDYFHIFNDNVSCKVFPNLGASVQELTINSIPVIDGIDIDKSGLEDYKNTYKSSLLFPFPNRVQDGLYIFNQEPYRLNINEKPLNNTIHGLVFNKKFELEKSEAKDSEATLTLSYTSHGDLEGFPFSFKFSVSYFLNTSGKLTVLFSAENLGDKAFPFGFGWHPYFNCTTIANNSLTFKGKDQFINSERNIPIEFVPSKLKDTFLIKDQFFDDAFTLYTPAVQLEDENYSLDLDFKNNTDAYLQIYTPPHRKSIAIEPMTCPADAFNNKYGLKILQPKKSYAWEMRLTIKKKR